jgi:hypothetical protein
MTMTTFVTPATTSEDSKESPNRFQEEVAVTTTLPKTENKEEENGSSSSVPVVVDAPTGEISNLQKVASKAEETARESTIPVVVVAEEAEKAITPAPAAGMVSMTETLKEDILEETTRLEKEIRPEDCIRQTSESEATVPTTGMEIKVNHHHHHHHQPVVGDVSKISDEAEMMVQPANPETTPAAMEEMNTMEAAQPVVKGDGQAESSIRSEAKESVQLDTDRLVVVDDMEVPKEKEFSSDQKGVQNRDTGNPVEDIAAVVNNEDIHGGEQFAIGEKTQTTSLDEKVNAEIAEFDPVASFQDEVHFVQHDLPDDEAVDIQENRTQALTKPTEPPSLLPIVSSGRAPEEMSPEIVSRLESAPVSFEERRKVVISEARGLLVEVKEEMNVIAVETDTLVAPCVADENKIHEEALQLHFSQKTSTVDGAEIKGGPNGPIEEVTGTVVSVECPDSSAATETEGPKPTGGGETSAVEAEDKHEHIPSECGKEEVLLPMGYENSDGRIATNAAETASAVVNFEPCVVAEKEELTSAQREQTGVASLHTTKNDIKIEEPSLTSVDGEGFSRVEKVDNVAESDDKLVGSEIDHPDADTPESLEECAERPASVDMKATGGSDELNTRAIEEQVAGFMDAKPTDQDSVEIPCTSLTADPVLADETSDTITMSEEKVTCESMKKPGVVVGDLEYSESHVSLSESFSSLADEEPTETSPEVEEEEDPEDEERILELKNVTAMTRVLIPADQRHHSAPVPSRWGWSTGTSSGTNMTGIGSASVTSKSSEKDGTASKTGSSESRWGLQTGLLSFVKSPSEAEENGQAKCELASNVDVSKPMAKKDEPLIETNEPESSSSLSSSSTAAVGSTAHTTSPTAQTKKNDPPKKKKMTDIEKARLFAASVLLESEHVVVKEEKEASPKRFGSWF